jgi:hypothetical protein
MDDGAGRDRGVRQADRIGERVDVAAPAVKRSRLVQRRTDHLGAACACQHLHRCMALLPIRCTSLQVAPSTGGMRGKDQAGAHWPAFDLVTADQLEHQIRPGRDAIDNPLASIGPIVSQNCVLPRLQIRHDLAERAA